jgi:peptidyl-tRNA hydrolase
MTGGVLEPLATRYADWLSLPASVVHDVADEDPAEVRAMPVILRIERTDPPSRTPLLEAAAAAAVAVCLDPRTDPEGEWHADVQAWIDGRIRKVSRRARGAHWEAVQALPGVTVTVDGASARALVPGRVVETPKEVSRLQISGSELPDDDPGDPPPDVPILWLNPKVEMTAGKAAAQVGHASMLLAAALKADGFEEYLTAWKDFRCAVRTPPLRTWANLHPGDDPLNAWRRRRVVAVRDAGFTEVAPGTVTVLAQLP